VRAGLIAEDWLWSSAGKRTGDKIAGAPGVSGVSGDAVDHR
jgi:hypothetical protein